MIWLDLKPNADLHRLDLAEFATGEGEARVVPALHLRTPGTATERAAHAVARSAVPGRDEGEDDGAYRERLRITLAAYGADALIDCDLPLSAVVEGAVSAIALTAHAKALIGGWEGFGAKGAKGTIKPSPTAIEAAMRHPQIASRFQRWVNDQLAQVTTEGNVSPLSAGISSQGARKTASTAKPKAPRAAKAAGSTPSGTTKPRHRAISARKSPLPLKPSKGL